MSLARILTLVLVTVSSLLAPAGLRSAASESDATCVLEEARMTVAPGLFWTVPGDGEFRSPLVPVTCTGTVEGHEITGPGEIRFFGTYEDSTCAVASGVGTLRVTLPTAKGYPLKLDGTIKWTAEGPAAQAEGTVGNSPFQAVGHFRPDPEHLEEDCQNKPLQHVILRGSGRIGG